MRKVFVIFILTSTTLLHSQELLPVKKDGKWGYINESGEVIIPAAFDYALDFRDGFAVARIEDLYGVINSNGQFVIEPGYEAIRPLFPGYFAVQKDLRWGLRSEQPGEILKMEWDKVDHISHDIVLLKKGSKQKLFKVSTRRMIDLETDQLELKEGRYLIAYKGKKQGILSPDLRWLYRIEYDEIRFFPNQYLILYKDGKLAVGSPAGVLLTDFSHYQYQVGVGFFMLRRDRDLYDLFTTPFNVLYQPDEPTLFYSRLTPNLIKVDGLNKQSLINNTGDVIIPAQSQQIYLYENGWLKIRRKKGWGLYTTEGREILPAEYYRIFDFRGLYAQVIRNGKRGLINSSGQVIISPDYDILEISTEQVKAYKGEGMDLFRLNNSGGVDEKLSFSKVKSISVQLKGRDLQVNSPTNLFIRGGWTFNRNLGLWGFKDVNDSLLIPYKYTRIRILNDSTTQTTNLTSNPTAYSNFRRKYDWIRPDAHGIVDHQRVGVRMANKYWKIFYDDFGKARVARFIFEGGRWGLVNPVGKRKMNYRVNVNGRIQRLTVTYVAPFSEGYAAICVGGYLEYKDGFDDPEVNGGRWGYVDRKGRMAIPPVYSKAERFIDGKAIVSVRNGNGRSTEEKFGVVDTSGKILIPISYHQITYQKEGSVGYFTLISNTPSQGLINRDGKLVVPAIYEKVYPFSEGLARARVNGKWGYIDKKGNVVVDFIYEDANDYSNGLAAVRNKKWGYIDQEGNYVISPQYREAHKFSEGRAAVRTKMAFQYINTSGELISKDLLTDAHPYENGYAVGRKKKWGLMDSTGTWVVNPRYRKLRLDAENGNLFAQRGRKYRLLDLDGSKLSPMKFSAIGDYHDGLVAVKYKTRYGYLDGNGETVIPFELFRAEPYSDSLARVMTSSGWAYIDRQGQKVFGTNSNFSTSVSEGRIFYRKRGGYGIMDVSGTDLKSGTFRKYIHFKNGFAVVASDDKYQFIDPMGRTAFNGEEFEKAHAFEGPVARVGLEGKWKLINTLGITVSADQYDYIHAFRGDYATVDVDLYVGLADSNGKIIMDPEVQRVDILSESLFRLERGDKIGYYDLHKGWIWPLD